MTTGMSILCHVIILHRRGETAACMPCRATARPLLCPLLACRKVYNRFTNARRVGPRRCRRLASTAAINDGNTRSFCRENNERLRRRQDNFYKTYKLIMRLHTIA